MKQYSDVLETRENPQSLILFSLLTNPKVNQKYIKDIFKSLVIELGNQSVFAIDKQGRTLLHYAAMVDNDGYIVSFLLNQGIDPSLQDKDGKTAFYYASLACNIRSMSILLQHGDIGNINFTCGKTKVTPLHICIAKGTPKMVELIISKGADVNKKSEDLSSQIRQGRRVFTIKILGKTPLHFAVGNEKYEVVKLLLKHAANPNEVCSIVYSPEKNIKVDGTCLDIAVIKKNTEMTKLLLESAQVDIDKCNEKLFFTFMKTERLEIINLILDKTDIDVNAERYQGILHWACAKGHMETVKLLVQKGADISKFIKAKTHLEFDEYSQFGESTEVKEKDLFDFLNITRDTPVCCAIKNDKTEIAKYLIEMGISLEPVEQSYSFCDIEIVNIPLHDAISRKNIEVVKALLEREDIDVNSLNKEGYTPLMLACGIDSVELVELLLKHEKLDINGMKKDGKTFKFFDDSDKNLLGCSALHFSVLKGNIKLIKLLLEHGAKIDLSNKIGQTALHFCVMGLSYHVSKDLSKVDDFIEIMNFLIDSGLDINAGDKDGRTVLNMLAAREYIEVEKSDQSSTEKPDILFEANALISGIFGNTLAEKAFIAFAAAAINKGANVNKPNSKGEPPILIAVKEENISMCDFLKSKGADLSVLDLDNKNLIFHAIDSEGKRLLRHQKRTIVALFGLEVVSVMNLGGKDEFVMVKWLLENGVDPNVRSTYGETAVQHAIREEKINIVKLLLQNGAAITKEESEKALRRVYNKSDKQKMEKIINDYLNKTSSFVDRLENEEKKYLEK